MYKVYLLLGSNLGNRQELLDKACLELVDALLPDYSEVSSLEEAVQSSKVYETLPWGFESNDKFLNMAFTCITELEPEAVLKACLDIETALGRVREGAQFNEKGERIYASRYIDIDILLIYQWQQNKDNPNGYWQSINVNTPALVVPHPRLHEREFAKRTLRDLKIKI